jgi:hypothetical protein
MHFLYSKCFDIDKRKPKYSGGENSLVMSASGSYVEPEERERRLRDLANRLIGTALNTENTGASNFS